MMSVHRSSTVGRQNRAGERRHAATHTNTHHTQQHTAAHSSHVQLETRVWCERLLFSTSARSSAKLPVWNDADVNVDEAPVWNRSNRSSDIKFCNPQSVAQSDDYTHFCR